MDRWTGVLAYLDTPALDGRVLQAPQELRTRDLPLPLASLGDAYERLGTIESVTVRGNELHGEGTLREGILRPGEKLPVGIDVDEVDYPDEDAPQVFVSWRLVAATVYVDQSRGEPAWPGVHIRLADA